MISPRGADEPEVAEVGEFLASQAVASGFVGPEALPISLLIPEVERRRTVEVTHMGQRDIVLWQQLTGAQYDLAAEDFLDALLPLVSGAFVQLDQRPKSSR